MTSRRSSRCLGHAEELFDRPDGNVAYADRDCQLFARKCAYELLISLLYQLATQTTKNAFKGVPPTWYINNKFSNQYKAMNGGTPGGIRYFGELEDHCYWGNKVKLYECHVDTLFYVLVQYYVCTINKTSAKPGQRMYFQVQYTEENLLDYIDPHNDTLMVRLEYHIMLGTDKRATITTNWSEFRRRANIREGDIYAFRFEVTSNRRLVLTVHPLQMHHRKTPQVMCQYNLALSIPNYVISHNEPMVCFWTLLSDTLEDTKPMPLLM